MNIPQRRPGVLCGFSGARRGRLVSGGASAVPGDCLPCALRAMPHGI
jgi:hypothetical protein